MPVPGSGTGGRAELPAEHGFRFFPGFYRHLPVTMARLPSPENARGVLDTLVGAGEILLAQGDGRNELIAPARLPQTAGELAAALRFVAQLGASAGIPPAEVAWFGDRLLTLLTSCEERRFGQWEQQSWWSFVGADHR